MVLPTETPTRAMPPRAAKRKQPLDIEAPLPPTALKRTRLPQNDATAAPAIPNCKSPLENGAASSVKDPNDSTQRTLDLERRVRHINQYKSRFFETITVLVGEEESPFTIHKTVASKCPFFEAACSERWIEGREGIVRLPAHKARVFEVFVDWLYSGKLDLTPLEPASKTTPKYQSFVRVWDLANYLCSFSLCRLITDTVLKEKSQTQPNVICFEICPPDSRMYALLIEQIMWSGDETILDKALPPELLRYMVRAFIARQGRESFNPSTRDPCYYHVHKEGDRCNGMDVFRFAE